MKIRLIMFVLLALVLAACSSSEEDTPATTSFSGIPTLPGIQAEPTPNPLPLPLDDPRFPIEPSAAGKDLYAANCSECHGVNGEGQPPDPSGIIVAPPHNASGHTWHHPDQANYAIVYTGRHVEGANEMPSFKDKLSEEEIFSILAYVKTLWEKDQQEQQRNITLNVAG